MRVNKLVVIMIIILISVVSRAQVVTETEDEGLSTENIILEQIEQLDLEQLQRKVAEINRSGREIIPAISLREIISGFISGDFGVNWQEIISLLLKYLGQEVVINLNLLGQIMILAIISAILKVFNDSFSHSSIGETANLIIFLVLAVLLLNSFQIAVRVGIGAIESMVTFLQALVPILLTLLVSLGAVSSAAIFHPLTFLIITTLSTGIKNIIIPMIFISFVLSVVNNITDEFNISRLAALFKEYSLYLLTLSLSLFIGSSLIQGGFAAISDSLTLRTAKFLSGKFIPVVGGIFSSALGLIVNCSLLIKNALNLMGILVILMIIIQPIIKIAALVIIYKTAAALLQPVSDPKLINILNTIAANLLLVLGVVIAVAMMFFIVITIIVGTANLTVMMR